MPKLLAPPRVSAPLDPTPAVASPVPPSIGEVVWYWTIRPMATRHEDILHYLEPRPAIVLGVGKGPSPALWLSLFGTGQVDERGNVVAAEVPTAEKWTRPVAGWTPDKGAVRRAPWESLVERDVIVSCTPSSMGSLVDSIGFVASAATIRAAHGWDVVDLEVTTGRPQNGRNRAGVRRSDVPWFDRWWHPKDDGAGMVGKMVRAFEAGEDPAGPPVESVGWVAEVYTREKVRLDLTGPDRSGWFVASSVPRAGGWMPIEVAEQAA